MCTGPTALISAALLLALLTACSDDAPRRDADGGTGADTGVDARIDAVTDAVTDAPPPADGHAPDGRGDSSTDGGSGDAGCSTYVVKVAVPPYDSSNAEHALIKTSGDWSQVNATGKRFFYIAPHADHGTVTITASGTAAKPRYLALHDSSGLHPAQLPVAKQANVRLVFKSAAHWVVDRLSSLDRPTQPGVEINPVSSNIVINRMNFSNFHGAVVVRSGADLLKPTHKITIQRCRMDRMSAAGIDKDSVAVTLMASPWNAPLRMDDVHILENEMRNCNDGVMPLRFPEQAGWQKGDFPGTVIDCNHIHVDNEVYTDGKGKHDPKGLWAWTENAIDIKGGSSDPARPMIVSNNVMWGYRRTDTNGGGSGSWGTAMGGHFYAKNLRVFNNVMFDSNRGLNFGGSLYGAPFSGENLHVHDNIFYNIGFETGGGTEYSNFFYDTKNVVFERNTIVGLNAASHWFAHNGKEVGLKVSCNVVVDSAKMAGTRAASTAVANNYFYNTPAQKTADGTSYAKGSDAKLKDLVITTDRYTNKPRTITLPGVLTTTASPHAGWCSP